MFLYPKYLILLMKKRTEVFEKSRKSQITIFVIIAVLIVVAIGIVFFVQSSLNKTHDTNPVIQTGSENIAGFVTNCLKLTAEEGLVVIGRQGGYYNFNSEPNVAYSGNDGEQGNLLTELGNINVPYYYDGVLNIPGKQDIADQLSLYIQENLNNCIKDFSIYTQKGYSVTNETLTATTSILDDEVKISLDYPVTIKKASNTQTKTTYNIEVPVRLGLAYNVSRDFVNMQSSRNTASFCMECVLVIPKSFHTQRLKYNDNTDIIIFTDLERKLNNNNYDFVIAYKY